VPTSVLLAVLTAAGLLALAPALVRRYDATERLVAERASSTARVLDRRRRRRSVPGRLPVNVSRARSVTLRASVPTEMPRAGGSSGRSRGSGPVPPARRRRRPATARRPVRRHSPAVYRRRRVFAALVLLNVIEVVGILSVGPGFWISFMVTATLLGAYVVHLRNRTIDDARRRRAQARQAAWLAARQAEVRREQARRAEQRREQQRRLAAQRESVRRAAMGMDRKLPSAGRSVSGGGSVSYRRAGGLRGRAYEAGGRAYEAGGAASHTA
jgi:hypothetical protein